MGMAGTRFGRNIPLEPLTRRREPDDAASPARGRSAAR